MFSKNSVLSFRSTKRIGTQTLALEPLITSETIYIGISTTFHDPAISIVDAEGNILFAEAAERYLQYKRAPLCESVPITYIPELLREFVKPDQEIVVATSWSDEFIKKMNRWSDLGVLDFNSVRDLQSGFTRSFVDSKTERLLVAELNGLQERAGRSILLEVNRIYGHSNISLHQYEHHLCHAA